MIDNVRYMQYDRTRRAAIPMVLVLSAFVLRLYAALVPGIIVPDGVVYIGTAKMIIAGQWQKVPELGVYSTYPFFIILFQKVFPNWETAGRMVSVVFGSLAVLPFYLLMKRMFDLKIVLVASLFFVIDPRLVEYSSNVIREPVFWLFSLTALWSAWEGIVKKSWIFMVCASFFVGLAALTRMEGIALALVICLWLFWNYWKDKEFGTRRLLLFILVFLVSFPILFAIPLTVLKSKRGQWEIGHLGSKIPYILKTGYKNADAVFKQTLEESDAVSRIVARNKYAFFLWHALYKFFRPFHVLFILLFVIGITRRKVVSYGKKEVPIVIWWSVYCLVSVLYMSQIYYLSTRHGMQMSIPALIWVSIGFFELNDLVERYLAKVRPGWRYARKVTVYMLALICVIILPSTLSWSGYSKVEMKKAGIYLKGMGYSQKRFAIEPRLIRLGFYTEGDYVVIPPYVNHATLDTFLRVEGIRYLVVDEKTVEGTIKGFKDHLRTFNLERIELPEFNMYREYSIAVFKTKE
ncbi:MAG: glycosyltransferase family 39 protein [Syntrophorhabdaceae bacterium]|nr:glycosyltransferase family 39 protein [Syntrophorhabdaceae bacterium]